MKRKIFKNPFFCLSIFLFGVLVFQVAGIVRGEGIWQGPTAPPPGGQPAAPLDTSGVFQTKSGVGGGLDVDSLNVRNNFNVKGYLSVGPNDGNRVRIQSVVRKLDFFNGDGVGHAAIEFREGKLKANHDVIGNPIAGWFDIGSGGGEGVWEVGREGGFDYLRPKSGSPQRVYIGTASPILASGNIIGQLQITTDNLGEALAFGFSGANSGEMARIWSDRGTLRLASGFLSGTGVDKGLHIDMDGNVVAGRGLEVKGDLDVSKLKTAGLPVFMITGMGRQFTSGLKFKCDNIKGAVIDKEAEGDGSANKVGCVCEGDGVKKQAMIIGGGDTDNRSVVICYYGI